MTTFPSVRIEGGLLGPDVLDQVCTADLPGQRSADFGLSRSRNLTDEIASVFADTRALWGVFQNRLDRLAPNDVATTVTRDAWVIPFLGLLGYELQYNPRSLDVDGATFAVSHSAGEGSDTPPVHIVGARQSLGHLPESGRPRMAPHSLVQEYLNRSEHLWGIVTNGLILRLLRDSTFVRRQSYVEFDLTAIIEEQRFQDFVALFRLLHRTRLPRDIADAPHCLLEQYYSRSIEQGGRVREKLRDGVEACIGCLADGFLEHRANDVLRDHLSPHYSDSDRIDSEKLYRQLLRVVYRLLFLLVSEDRGLLSPDPLYREHYGIARLRQLVDRREAYTDHDDLWQSLRVLWMVFGDEELAAMLKLAPLNGELFSPQDLDGYTLTNKRLLEAIWHLVWYRENETGPSRRVNYAALDVEELGSVYESLLEYHPDIYAPPGRAPVFRLLFGSERKSTGSYYTPPQLVGELIKSALEPIIEDRLGARPADPEKAILSIRVCDPACGSGHFLLAAARRLGKEVARVRSGEEEPAPERVREAIRDVISHCIYGVDKNPLAVDLCRVALWLESSVTDKPLTFLDHRIRCGDSLIGVFDLAALRQGIPDEAFKALEGDDKDFARDVRARNREEKSGQIRIFGDGVPTVIAGLAAHSHEVDDISDDTPAEIRRKKELYERNHADTEWMQDKEACDLWTAAFFQPLTPETPAITTGSLRDRMNDRHVDERVLALANALSVENRFFHWPLEFPEVFADGGFDVVLSNPPWERVKLQELEFFAVRDSRIANAPTKAARTALIRTLPNENAALYRDFMDALRTASAASGIMRNGGRYPLAGRGDINTYAVFAELASSATKPNGRAGMILPTGIATDDTTKFYFGSLVKQGRLVSLTGFENEDFIFPAVHHAFKFCTLVIGGVSSPVRESRIAFYIRKYEQLSEGDRFFTLGASDFLLLNPNTGNCPIFRYQKDAELAKAIYRRVPVLWREAAEDQTEKNPWKLSFNRMFDMANDSHHFRTEEELEADDYRLEGNVYSSPYDRYLPLYEAKMVHQFDHRFSTYEGATESQLNVGILPQPTPEQKIDPSFVVQPRYWVREEVVESAIPKYPEPLAIALRLEDRPSIQCVLCRWAAGYHIAQGEQDDAQKLFHMAARSGLNPKVMRALGAGTEEDHAVRLQEDFPLDEADIETIISCLAAPEDVAQELVERFSPKWLLGWRDVTNSTNERSLIAGTLPRTAVGHKFQLIFSTVPASMKMCLESVLNSFVVDFCARQKIGGMSFSYFILRQTPVVTPKILSGMSKWSGGRSLHSWLLPRVLELVYTSNDLALLARDCGCEEAPYVWNDARRFEIRCELDAAFFHLYLPCDSNGAWRPARRDEGAVVDETPEHLAELAQHFPTPRHAVDYILEQFPTVKKSDVEAYARYRTKDRILEIYDAMLAAHRFGVPYKTSLEPPPGERR